MTEAVFHSNKASLVSCKRTGTWLNTFLAVFDRQLVSVCEVLWFGYWCRCVCWVGVNVTRHTAGYLQRCCGSTPPPQGYTALILLDPSPSQVKHTQTELVPSVVIGLESLVVWNICWWLTGNCIQYRMPGTPNTKGPPEGRIDTETVSIEATQIHKLLHGVCFFHIFLYFLNVLLFI